MKPKLILLFLMTAVLVGACASAEAAPGEPPGEPLGTVDAKPTTSDQSRTTIGQGFTLGEGESVWIEDDQYQITLVEVIEDSRCPVNAECFWEGNAKVLIRVGEEEHILTLGKLLEGDVNSVTLGDGLSLRVVEISPYPGSEQDGQPYQVTLMVENETSQPYQYPAAV
jgi:hypothetical protein